MRKEIILSDVEKIILSVLLCNIIMPITVRELSPPIFLLSHVEYAIHRTIVSIKRNLFIDKIRNDNDYIHALVVYFGITRENFTTPRTPKILSNLLWLRFNDRDRIIIDYNLMRLYKKIRIYEKDIMVNDFIDHLHLTTYYNKKRNSHS